MEKYSRRQKLWGAARWEFKNRATVQQLWYHFSPLVAKADDLTANLLNMPSCHNDWDAAQSDYQAALPANL
jgi:hypothetical protein